MFNLTKLFVTDHRMTNEAVFRADGTDGKTLRELSIGKTETEGRQILRYPRVALRRTLTRDLSLSRVPHGHYEERSRQPV